MLGINESVYPQPQTQVYNFHLSGGQAVPQETADAPPTSLADYYGKSGDREYLEQQKSVMQRVNTLLRAVQSGGEKLESLDGSKADLNPTQGSVVVPNMPKQTSAKFRAFLSDGGKADYVSGRTVVAGDLNTAPQTLPGAIFPRWNSMNLVHSDSSSKGGSSISLSHPDGQEVVDFKSDKNQLRVLNLGGGRLSVQETKTVLVYVDDY